MLVLNKLTISSFIVLSLLGLPVRSNGSESTCQRKFKKPLSLKSALTFNTINSIIIAKFAPKDSQGKPIELNKLASRLGYDHFNWVSYVEHDPYGMANKAGSLLSTPYNDPPPGGYQYETADELPFYWDLEECDRCQQHYHYRHPRITRKFELIFEDFPSDHRLQPGEAVKFVTHLVGVKNYDLRSQQAKWNVITTFRWKLTNSVRGKGKVSLIEKDVALTELSPSLLTAMQTEGGILPAQVYALVPQLKLPETVAIAKNPDRTQSSCSM
ncbi:hypothetical protein [Myxosarcina sp. GI1(2024)]